MCRCVSQELSRTLSSWTHWFCFPSSTLEVELALGKFRNVFQGRMLILHHCNKISDRNSLMEEGGSFSKWGQGSQFQGVLINCGGKGKGRVATFVAVGTQGTVMTTRQQSRMVGLGFKVPPLVTYFHQLDSTY